MAFTILAELGRLAVVSARWNRSIVRSLVRRAGLSDLGQTSPTIDEAPLCSRSTTEIYSSLVRSSTGRAKLFKPLPQRIAFL